MASAAAEAFAAKHNAGLKKAETLPATGHNSGAELKEYLKRRVSLEQDKKNVAEDIRELNAEAKEHDIDPRALAVMAKRELEDAEAKAKRLALQETVDAYAATLGFLD